MLAISLRQRNDGQLSCLNRFVLGVRKGARRMERATAAWIRSMDGLETDINATILIAAGLVASSNTGENTV